jgi:hypothetical protein
MMGKLEMRYFASAYRGHNALINCGSVLQINNVHLLLLYCSELI